MSDPFTRDKLAWLDQVHTDRGVSDGAFRLCYLLASRYINRKTLDSFCGQKRLADDLGMTLRGIRKLLDQLTMRGHLLITKPAIQGRGHVDRCRWNIKRGTPVPLLMTKGGTPVPLLATRKEEPPFRKRRNHRSRKEEPQFLRLPLRNPFERIPLSDDAMLIQTRGRKGRPPRDAARA